MSFFHPVLIQQNTVLISSTAWKSACSLWLMNHADDKLNPKSLSSFRKSKNKCWPWISWGDVKADRCQVEAKSNVGALNEKFKLQYFLRKSHWLGCGLVLTVSWREPVWLLWSYYLVNRNVKSWSIKAARPHTVSLQSALFRTDSYCSIVPCVCSVVCMLIKCLLAEIAIVAL